MPAERKEGMSLFDSLLKIATAVKNETAPLSELENLILSFEEMVQKARQELQNETQPELSSEVEQIESSLLLFEAGTAQIKKYIIHGNENFLNDGIKEIQHSLQEMETGAVKFTLKKNGLNPSQEKSFNLMFNYFRFFQEGKCGEDAFQEMAHLHETRFVEMERHLRKLTKNQNLQFQLSPMLDAVNQRLPDASAALRQIMTDISQKSYQNLSEKFQTLQVCWNHYHDLLKQKNELDRTLEQQGKICPRCHVKNHLLAQNCHSCSFLFPPIEASEFQFDISEESAKVPLFGEIFEKLKNAIEDLEDKIITQDSFNAALDWINKKLDQVLAALKAVTPITEKSSESDPFPTEEKSRIFTLAMDQYSKGIKEVSAVLEIVFFYLRVIR